MFTQPDIMRPVEVNLDKHEKMEAKLTEEEDLIGKPLKIKDRDESAEDGFYTLDCKQ